MMRVALGIAALSLVACGGEVEGAQGSTLDGGARVDATTADGAALDGRPHLADGGPGDARGESVGHHEAGADSSGTGGGPVDAGYYFGDGSFWVEGGAYHDLPDGSSPGPEAGAADGGAGDASSGCGALSVCCATLTGSAQTLCNTIAGSGNPTNCATELTELESLGDCTGVTIVASGIESPASRLLSDGTLLFWTDYLQSAGLLAVPVSGGKVTTLLTGIVQLVAVDDVNVYVLVAGNLDSFGIGDIDTNAMQDVTLVRIPKSGAPATRISGTGTVWAATTLAGTVYWLECPTTSGPASSVAAESAPMTGGPASTITTLSATSPGPLYDAITQIGVTNSTLFVGAFSSVESVPITGGAASVGTKTFCESFASDTGAVYCDVGTGSNLRIASDGTTSTLGAVVNPAGTDPFPYIAYDDTYAYWANNATAGAIMRAPKAGGGPATVLASDTSPTAIAVDSRSVYWSDVGGYIKSIPK